MDKRQLAETTTDPVILDELSRDEDWLVRFRVALNPNTTPEILDYLSKDEDWLVRICVAKNFNTTPETLDYLSRDKGSTVRWCVAQNPNTTPETLKEMAKVETNYDIITAIKIHPNCPEETWRYLSALEILETLSEVST
jgi:hypothetical protein